MGDSAYGSSQYMLVPYSGQIADTPDNVKFNERFSAGRVIIEHVMGLLKSRWSS